MNILAVADIHSNLPALEAVFRFIRSRKLRADAVLVLGDIIGYGPFPNQCVEYIRALGTELMIAGNHEWALLDKARLGDFNPHAREAILFTRKVLSGPNLRFLAGLKESRTYVRDGFSCLMVHGSPRDAVMEYIQDPVSARINLDHMAERICFFAHTHIPVIFTRTGKEAEMLAVSGSMSVRVKPDKKCLVNPGSVGQPRDRDPRASFCIIDTEENEYFFYRVPYSVHAVRDGIFKFELPPFLGERLLYGI